MDSSFFKPGLTQAFASNAEDIATIPDTKPGYGRASISGGFPHETSIAIADSGIPPWLMDMNGILNTISYPIYLMSCGMPIIYNSDFSAKIGGYPKHAVVWNNDRQYISLIENNTLDPSNVNAWAIRTPAAATSVDQNNTTDYITGALLAAALGEVNGNIPHPATQTEVNDGTNNTDFVTPLTLANRFQKYVSDGQNGETGWEYSLNGTIKMWTTTDWLSGGEKSLTVPYPKPLSILNNIQYSIELKGQSGDYGDGVAYYNPTLTSVGIQELAFTSHSNKVDRRIHLIISGVPA